MSDLKYVKRVRITRNKYLRRIKSIMIIVFPNLLILSLFYKLYDNIYINAIFLTILSIFILLFFTYKIIRISVVISINKTFKKYE